jgi:hypothetical protein
MKYAKKAKAGDASQSTNSKGFGAGSKKGIPADAKPGQNAAKTKGSKATFGGGKKKVSKG